MNNKPIIIVIACVVLMCMQVSNTKADFQIFPECDRGLGIRVDFSHLVPNAKYTMYLDNDRFSSFVANSDGTYTMTHEAVVKAKKYSSFWIQTDEETISYSIDLNVTNARCGFKVGSPISTGSTPPEEPPAMPPVLPPPGTPHSGGCGKLPCPMEQAPVEGEGNE